MPDWTPLDTIKETWPHWAGPFLETFSRNANVAESCRKVKVGRSTAYLLREQDAEFAEAWRQAEQHAVESLEREAWRRARDGVKRRKGVYYKGDLVATEVETEYSDSLMMFLLKAHRPDKYREPVNRVALTDPSGVEDRSGYSDDDLLRKAAAIVARRTGDAGKVPE